MCCHAFAGVDFSGIFPVENPYLLALPAVLSAMFLLFLAGRFFISQKGVVIEAWLNLILRGLLVAIILKLALSEDAIFAPLFAAGLLAAFLFDSVIIRMGVFAFSMDGSGLFLKKAAVDSAWRPDLKFLRLKRAIESGGMRKSGSYMAASENGFRPDSYSTVFISGDAKTVLEVSFEDFGKGLATCSRAASQSDDGTIVLTSSGFESEIFPPVPDGIDAEFHPLNSNPLKTLHRHSRRISKYGNFSLLDDTVFERINNAFEQKCRADGLINTPEDISESGLLTGRGAYLAWKAALRLRYFGM